jgi:hypothetical protein
VEKQGTPAVILVSEKFKTLAKMEADALDMPNIRMLVLPHPIGILSDSKLRVLAKENIEQIENLLLQAQEQ